MKKHVALIALALTGGCDYVTSGTVKAHAEEDARRYARTFHPTWTHPVVDCQGVDSDHDHYVRCTIGDGAGTTEPIECRVSVAFNYQRGCVTPRNLPRGVR